MAANQGFLFMHSQMGNESQKDYNQSSGGLFLATVTGSDAGTYVIEVAPQGQTKSILQGVPLSSMMAHLLGFKECSLPQVGSEVLCYRISTTQCVIFGILPKSDLTAQGSGFPRRTLLGAGDGLNDKQNALGYHGTSIARLHTKNMNRATDVVEGEQAFVNDFGVMLGLFQQFATLKASELSQIQCFVLDDLVRIVSHNFQHYSCLGEYNVFHDGQGLHMEFGVTHDAKEGMGQPQSGASVNGKPVLEDTKKNEVDDSTNFVKLKDNEQLQAVSRLKGFVGALGDFLQLLLVRPAESSQKATDGVTPKEFDKGLFNLHLTKDGGLHVRSLKAISFEKTNWIRVPQRIRTPDDPEGDDTAKADFLYKAKETFEFNNDLKFLDSPYLYFLQMRDYLAYVQEELAYSNFKKHEKDFALSKSPTIQEKPSSEIHQVDPGTTTRLEPRVSGCYLMPNGGVMFKDAWGSALVLEGGNIYLQPAKDLVLQPMRNMVAKVGGHTSIATRKDIDLSSTDGGYRLKTDKSQYQYSANGGVILHSDITAPLEVVPSDGKAPIELMGGILLRSPKSSIVQHSKYNYTRVTEMAVSKAKISVMEAENLLHLISQQNLSLFSTKETLITSADSLIATAKNSVLLLGDNSTTVGKENQIHAVAIGGSVQGFMKQDVVDNLLDKLDNLEDLTAAKSTPSFAEDEAFDKVNFRFPNSAAYKLNPLADKFPQTIAQQDDFAFNNLKLVSWVEKAVNDTYPFPGKDFKNNYVGVQLQNLEQVNHEQFNKIEGLRKDVIMSKTFDLFAGAYRVTS